MCCFVAKAKLVAAFTCYPCAAPGPVVSPCIYYDVSANKLTDILYVRKIFFNQCSVCYIIGIQEGSTVDTITNNIPFSFLLKILSFCGIVTTISKLKRVYAQIKNVLAAKLSFNS